MSINNLYVNDCLIQLAEMAAESVDLVYFDPPFFTQKLQKLKNRDNTQEYCFSDVWQDLEDYKNYIKARLEQCRRVLKNTGSIFVHCDSSASHHLRILLDEVFGEQHFQSEIIWSYRRWSNARRGLLNAHQTIYFYSKSDNYKFHTLYTDYSPTTNLDQILQERERNEHNKSVYKKNSEGLIVLGKEKKGVPLSNVWEIPYLNPKAAERTGYPTQKPILLLERIIEIATDEGDIVLDPMCGSGTALVAARLLKRQWIGIDTKPEAIELTRARLENPQKTFSRLLEAGKAAYLNQDDKTRNILTNMDAFIVERNNGIDGFLKTYYLNTPVAIRIQREHESLEEAKKALLQASATRRCILKILVRTTNYQTLIFTELENIDNNLIIVDSYDFLVNQWIKRKEHTAHQFTGSDSPPLEQRMKA